MPRWLKITMAIIAVLLIPAAVALSPLPGLMLGAFATLRGAGPSGVIAFAAMYVIAGPFTISAELMMAASGFLYGPVNGTLLAWVCGHGAALANLALARTLLRERLRRRMGETGMLADLEEALLDRGVLVVFLLRLPPLSPFHVLGYGLGLTRVRVRDVMLGTALGSLPQVALFATIGSSVADITSLTHATAGISPLMWALIVVGSLGATVALTLLARNELKKLATERFS